MPRLHHFLRRNETRFPHPLAKLWILRILVVLGNYRKLLGEHGFMDEDIALAIGLGKWVDHEDFKAHHREIIHELKTAHASCEASAHTIPKLPILRKNLHRIGKLVKLSSTERAILEFAIFLRTEAALNDACNLIGEISTLKLCEMVSEILDVPLDEVRKSFTPHSALFRSGLLAQRISKIDSIPDRLELISANFADFMISSEAHLASILQDFVSISAPPALNLTHFDHLDKDLKLVIPYLETALTQRTQGVNILIHGAPGTGKTQLCRALAQHFKATLYEISCSNQDDDTPSKNRLNAYALAQRFFNQKGNLFLFDEIEDVFTDGSFMDSSQAKSKKAWINAILEENSIPTFWVSNSLYGLDRAFIRRFKMVLPVPIPKQSKRESIIRTAAGAMLSDNTIKLMAQSPHLSPALITQAVEIVSTIQTRLGEHTPDDAVCRLVNHTLDALRQPSIKPMDPNRLPQHYDTRFIRTDVDLQKLSQGLKQTGTGRICLYGPPGTGKTAFGRWLAEALEKPLLVKRASDFLDKYVGETEKRIAKAFRDAADDHALLMIDEVDSFLQDRKSAQYSWEKSQVNEMLTQIESFPGIFIASTNLMEGLDPAAMRRFDLKIQFGYLSADQAETLLQITLERYALPAATADQRSRLGEIPHLTPGDFANLDRQQRLTPFDSAEEVITALMHEVEHKSPASRPIGFIRHA